MSVISVVCVGTYHAMRPPMRIRTVLRAPAAIVVGLAVAAVLMTAIDTLARDRWHEVDRLDHALSVFALMLAVAGGVGVAGSLPALGAALAGGAHRRRVTIALCLAAAALAWTLFRAPVGATLAGVADRAPETAHRLATGGLLALAAAAMIVTAAAHTAAGAEARALPGVTGLVLLAAGVALGWADATILVALYAGAHEIAEVMAWGAMAAGAGLLAWRAVCHERGARVIGTLAVATVVWSGGFSLSASLRTNIVEERLAHVWREPGQATRMCLRFQLLEGYLRDPSGWQGRADARMRKLIERYDIASVAQAARWDLPVVVSESEPVPARRPLNVVVVFVDTLRADTALDPAVMPRLAAMRARSLSFTRAYAAASDTVSALPVMTGGCFGQVPCPQDVLAFAQERSIPTGLVIAKSARRFLAKHAPHFTFSDVVEVVDYAEGKKVWGYGADGATADTVTRETLSWIEAHRAEQFMLWAFHFDVHNWMNLDHNGFNSSATTYASAHGVDKKHRYNAAAANVDAALGELIDGIDDLGLADDTAIVVVSDHGEALGHRGHAYHAVYLWDALVHVPLVVHVPGVAPAVVASPTGHVDIAPTLLSLLEPSADARHFHGVSLLASEARRREALPLLMFSMRRDELLRIGIVGRDAPLFKLELPFDSVEPELYDLTASDPDAVDLRHTHHRAALQLLSALVTSPVFPREVASP